MSTTPAPAPTERRRVSVRSRTVYMDELPQAGRGGGVDILVKPYREEDLLARVRKALNGTADASSPPITVVPAL